MNSKQTHDSFMSRIDDLLEMEAGTQECEQALTTLLEDIDDRREEGVLSEVSADHLFRTLEGAGFDTNL